MNDYEKYVTEVNNIFAILEKLKNKCTNNDNLDSIETINEYKNSVIKTATFLQKQVKKVSNTKKELI